MIVFWSGWLLVVVVLVIMFLVKIPSLLVRRMVTAVYGAGDCGILTANLQNGVSILYEPFDAASRQAARYQLYQRNSRRVFFKGEWKLSVSSAEYKLFCFDERGKLIEILKVSEAVNLKRFTKSVELPEGTDYVVFRVTRLDGVKSREKFGKRFYLLLALFALCCAAAVCALTAMVCTYVSLVTEVSENFWSYAALSAAAVCLVVLIAYAAACAWLILKGRNKREKTAVPKKRKKRRGRGVFSCLKYFIGSLACGASNLFKSLAWKTPFRKRILRGMDAAPNARALKRAIKSKDK